MYYYIYNENPILAYEKELSSVNSIMLPHHSSYYTLVKYNIFYTYRNNARNLNLFKFLVILSR